MQYIDEKIVTVEGKLVTKRYSLLGKVGEGAFSQCYKVQVQGTDQVYALKIISKETMKILEKEKLGTSASLLSRGDPRAPVAIAPAHRVPGPLVRGPVFSVHLSGVLRQPGTPLTTLDPRRALQEVLGHRRKGHPPLRPSDH